MNRWTRWESMLLSGRPASESGVFRRIFAAYVGVALLMVVLAAAVAIWQTHVPTEPKRSMKKAADSVTANFFLDMLGLESAHLKRQGETTFSSRNVGGYIAKLLLQIEPGEPKSLLASQLRGLNVAAGEADASTATADKPGGGRSPEGPTAVAGASGSGANAPDGTGNAAAGSAPGDGAAGGDGTSPSPTDSGGTPGGASAGGGTVQPQPTGGTGQTSADPVQAGGALKPGSKVFVYHSHPRESWVPELNASSAAEAEDPQTNVTLVGKRLSDKLEQTGIGAIHSATDYPTEVEGYNWNYSYKYSLQTVKEAFEQHRDIAFLFDIHRDAAPRDVTTATIGGVDYAKVYFIVGKKNAHWEQNEAFARRIHDKLEKEYPGLSRGIWDKGSGGHAEYNQSVSPNSILIEVGGPYNTLEESYRTADALAKAIADVYRESVKVDAKPVVAASANQAADAGNR